MVCGPWRFVFVRITYASRPRSNPSSAPLAPPLYPYPYTRFFPLYTTMLSSSEPPAGRLGVEHLRDEHVGLPADEVGHHGLVRGEVVDAGPRLGLLCGGGWWSGMVVSLWAWTGATQ